MEEVLKLLPALGILVITNIALGMWNKIGKEKFNFSLSILLQGITRAVIIVGSAIGLSYVASIVDITASGPLPDFILNGAIAIYATKAVHNFASCLGVDISVGNTGTKDTPKSDTEAVG